jgi:AraC-like DNA-binding protein
MGTLIWGSPVNRNEHWGGAASDYREFRPPMALAEYLLCFWTQTIRSPVEFLQRVLPDGCVDILLLDEVPMVVGPWTEAFVAPLAPGTNIIGARCHPGLAPSLLGMPAAELLNRSVPLGDVWGSAGTARFRRIADEPSLSARMSAMEAALLGRVANAIPADKATRAAIQWVARHPHGRVEQLSQWLGLSSRQIQRRFTMAVGYGPKLFQSVLRFQRLLNLVARAGIRRNLAQVAADADYADQAHMTREVQRFSGNPPSKLLQSPRCALGLSNLIQTTGGPDL